MAKEAIGIVFENTQLMKGITTLPQSRVLPILDAESTRMDKPEVAIETSVAINKITSSFPVYSYEEDKIMEEELFRRIAMATDEISLPKKIIIERSMYLRDKPAKNIGWFSFDKKLKDEGYDQDYGGIHDVNYVIARLTGFHILQRDPTTKRGKLMYTEGRDILLSSLFISEAEVLKNNKDILDDILL